MTWGYVTAVVVIIAVVSAGLYYTYQEGESAGYNRKAAEVAAAMAERDRQQKELIAAHRQELDAIARERAESEAKAYAHIKKLLSENTLLSEWWKTAVPDDAVIHAWWLPDGSSGDGDVQVGPEPASANSAPHSASQRRERRLGKLPQGN